MFFSTGQACVFCKWTVMDPFQDLALIKTGWKCFSGVEIRDEFTVFENQVNQDKVSIQAKLCWLNHSCLCWLWEHVVGFHCGKQKVSIANTNARDSVVISFNNDSCMWILVFIFLLFSGDFILKRLKVCIHLKRFKSTVAVLWLNWRHIFSLCSAVQRYRWWKLLPADSVWTRSKSHERPWLSLTQNSILEEEN